MEVVHKGLFLDELVKNQENSLQNESTAEVAQSEHECVEKVAAHVTEQYTSASNKSGCFFFFALAYARLWNVDGLKSSCRCLGKSNLQFESSFV